MIHPAIRALLLADRAAALEHLAPQLGRAPQLRARDLRRTVPHGVDRVRIGEAQADVRELLLPYYRLRKATGAAAPQLSRW
jgi:hypothetical protein